MKHTVNHCENCIKLVARINELEAFTEWINEGKPNMIDILSRIGEVLPKNKKLENVS